MSVKNINEVINVLNVTNHDSLLLDKNDDYESNLVLASISIRDFKMLQFINDSLRNNHTITIYNGYRQ